MDGSGGSVAVDDSHAAHTAPVPPLVQVLGGNPVTATTVFACLTTADVNSLRRLHPTLPAAVARVPWADIDAAVVCVGRWRKVLPAAVGVQLTRRAIGEPARALRHAAAALAGLTHVDLQGGEHVRSNLLRRLPASVRLLSVRDCSNLKAHAIAVLAHLTVLESLDCRGTALLASGAAGLPPSLQELDISGIDRLLLPAGISLAHLSALRVLRASRSALDSSALALLPPSLVELYAAECYKLSRASRFAHLPALCILDVFRCAISDASLASLPSSLLRLRAELCGRLTPAAALPHLPALQELDVSRSNVGDALVASLPASLVELRLMECRNVTFAATLDHVPALRTLHSVGTNLAPGVLDACRECVVPAVGRSLEREIEARYLTVLSGDRLACADNDGTVWVWVVGEAAWTIQTNSLDEHVLVPLPDGRRLAIGQPHGSVIWQNYPTSQGWVEVWDATARPPVHLTTINCNDGVRALAVLADGRLAAGCNSGKVRIVVDGDASAVVLEGHTSEVTALAVLPDGRLVSRSSDSMRVWDVSTHACVATQADHSNFASPLAVLADGRLALATNDNTVQLWDVGATTCQCVGVLAGHRGEVHALAALPDGRLATRGGRRYRQVVGHAPCSDGCKQPCREHRAHGGPAYGPFY